MRYDPDVQPDPRAWLALDEGEQIAMVEDYHRRAGIRLPRATLHAAIHAVIERQLADQLPTVVSTLERLRREGLDRHDAIHALGSVLAEHMRQLVVEEIQPADSHAAYFAALERLTAESWRSEFETDDSSA